MQMNSKNGGEIRALLGLRPCFSRLGRSPLAPRPSRLPSFFVLAFYRVSKENKRLLAVYNNIDHHHENKLFTQL